MYYNSTSSLSCRSLLDPARHTPDILMIIGSGAIYIIMLRIIVVIIFSLWSELFQVTMAARRLHGSGVTIQTFNNKNVVIFIFCADVVLYM